MILLSIGILRLINKEIGSKRMTIALCSVLLLTSPLAFGQEGPKVVEVQESAVSNENQCEASASHQELDERFEQTRKSFESDYGKGLPAQLTKKLMALRISADNISGKIFDVDATNNMEMNNLVSETLTKIDEFIAVIGQVSQLAPKVRDDFVVPYANVSSLKGEAKGCLVVLRKNASEEPTNVYEKISEELQSMNDKLFVAERVSPQKYIALRGELVDLLKSYNQSQSEQNARRIISRIPFMVNSMQSEIENVLPGFQLSQTYLSYAAF